MLTTRKKSKGKKDKLSSHKKKAWTYFSLYVRTRDSLKTTGGLEECVCCTCGLIKPRLGEDCIQAGHWIPGRNNAVLFSEEGVHGQCGYCNRKPPRGKGGNPIKYWIFMEKTYGRKVMDRLIAESNQTVIYKNFTYDAIAEKYKRKLERLLASNV